MTSRLPLGSLREIVDAGEVLDVLRRGDERACGDVERVGDVAAEHVGADQSAQIEIAVPSDGYRLVRHVMCFVEHVRRNALGRQAVLGGQAEWAGEPEIVEQIPPATRCHRGGVDHLAVGRGARVRVDDGEEVGVETLIVVLLVRRPDRQIARAGVRIPGNDQTAEQCRCQQEYLLICLNGDHQYYRVTPILVDPSTLVEFTRPSRTFLSVHCAPRSTSCDHPI